MNLGDAHLKFVNTSRPQLLHSDSKRSVTASDDYYSLSEPASEPSSGDDPAAIVRYGTPPSQMHSPHPSRDLLRSGTTSPRRKELPAIDTTSKSIKFVEKDRTNTDTAAMGNMKTWKSTKSDVSPPTPGVDDTPYIQFAIDQLTRDEELTGRRRVGVSDGDVSPIDEDFHEVLFEPNHAHQIVPQAYQGGSDQILEPPVSPLEPEHVDDNLVPARPPEDSFRFPSLNYIPGPLRLLSLVGLMVCCLIMIALLMVSSVWAAKHNGLWPYDGLGTNRYNLFEFVPQILGAFILLWLFAVQAALQRILPFTLLASARGPQHTGALDDVSLFLTNYLTPNLSSFKHKEPILGLCSLIFWLNVFTIPLLSCVFQTRLYLDTNDGVWMWTTVQPVAWVLIVLYWLLLVALMLLALRLATRPTGLKWDPTSLADIFVLLRRSNLASNFHGSEVQAVPIRSRPASLGYWRPSNRPSDIFYAIGEDHASALERHRQEAQKRSPQIIDLESQQPNKGLTIESLQIDVHSPAVRYRWTPWFLRETWWILWLVMAFVLTTAFLIASFVHQAVSFGFLPLLPAPTTALGFSPANFLYSFIPSLIGMFLFLAWQPIDTYYRALEPFARLADPRGATAEQSLLLCYPAYLPLEVSLRAALAGHYRVAWISFVSLLSITLPVLAGGLFTAEFNVPAQDVREVASMPAYYALVVFVLVYALSFLALWPGPKHYLPHDIRTVGDIISFVYQSRMTADAAFREPRTKTDLVTRLLSVPRGEGQVPRYAFGVYVGRDGVEHLGIDRLKRPGSGEMVVPGGRA
ncbi:hypothetical protein MMC26_004740 [Xylographa opegraphella]|nr:hypothetical protein [Xylographa opegraphella]